MLLLFGEIQQIESEYLIYVKVVFFARTINLTRIENELISHRVRCTLFKIKVSNGVATICVYIKKQNYVIKKNI